MTAKNQRAIDFLTSRIGENCGDTHATCLGTSRTWLTALNRRSSPNGSAI
jgi:hypothetical protein